MKRLFVAVDFPEEWKRHVAALCSPVPGVRWVDESHLHLTLQFLGSVDEAAEKGVRRALSLVSLPPFEVAAIGVGAFPSPRRARVVWVGLDRCDPLLALQRRVGEVLKEVGFPPEERPFSPHVTIGRIKAGAPELPAFIAKHAAFRLPAVHIDSFRLFSSLLAPKGPVYTVEQEYPLREA